MHFFWRLKHGDNLSKSSFLEALLGLEFGHADFADDADFDLLGLGFRRFREILLMTCRIFAFFLVV